MSVWIKLMYLVPIAVVFFLGYLSSVTGYFRANESKSLIAFLQRFSIPAVSFLLFYETKFSDFVKHLDFAWMFALVTLIPLIIVKIYAGYKGHSTKETTLIAASSAMSDLPVMGFLLILCLPHGDSLIPLLSIAFSVQIFFLIVLIQPALIDKFGALRHLYFLKILRMPVIIASILGVIWMTLDVPLSPILHKPIDGIAKTIPVVGLIGVGMLVSFRVYARLTKMQIIVMLAKCVAMPLIAYLVATLFHLDQINRFALIAFSVCPSASYLSLLAEQCDTDSSVIFDTTMATFFFSIILLLLVSGLFFDGLI